MDLADLRAEVRFLTDTNTTSYTNADVDTHVNNYYDTVTGEIVKACDRWDFSGKIATTDTVANQQGYNFPTGILTIKRAEYTPDGTTWYPLSLIDISSFNESSSDTNTNQSSSKPFAELHDDGIYIYPTPTVSTTDGLKMWYQKDVEHLVDAGDEPLIVKPYQKVLAYGAALDFFIKNGPQSEADRMEMRYEKMLQRLLELYSFRVLDNDDRIVSQEEYYGESYK
jgi:hypothetical protein